MVHVVVEWPLMGKIRNYILKMLLYIYFYFSGMERRKPQRSTIKFTKNRTLTVYLPLSYLNGFYFVTSDLTKKNPKKKSQLFLEFPTYSPMSFDVLWANNIMLKGVSSKPSGNITLFIFIELNYPKFSLENPFNTFI